MFLQELKKIKELGLSPLLLLSGGGNSEQCYQLLNYNGLKTKLEFSKSFERATRV